MEKLNYKHERFIQVLHALGRSIEFFLRADIDEEMRHHLVASLIKHFELCYEVCWKFLKLYLECRYDEKFDSPKKVFRQCCVVGLLDEQITEKLLDIAEARNVTTHTYDEEQAQEICKRISQYYLTFQKISLVNIQFDL